MSKCWYCNNKLTTGDNPKHFGICNKCYDEMFKSGDTIIRSLTDKITDLEAKLAEKDKEIKNLVIAHFESEINKPVLTTTQMINQDKISFAVEQLEKVKEFVNDFYGEYSASVTTNFIDNQIKSLKGEE